MIGNWDEPDKIGKKTRKNGENLQTLWKCTEITTTTSEGQMSNLWHYRESITQIIATSVKKNHKWRSKKLEFPQLLSTIFGLFLVDKWQFLNNI